MQSLGKHVEGMIHLKTTEAPKTQAVLSYLYDVNETRMRETGPMKPSALFNFSTRHFPCLKSDLTQ